MSMISWIYHSTAPSLRRVHESPAETAERKLSIKAYKKWQKKMKKKLLRERLRAKAKLLRP